MVSAGLQIVGIVLSIIGWIGTILACALPQWKVTTFIGPILIASPPRWEGIWMNCVVLSTGRVQCRVNDLSLHLSQDLQAVRALVIISILAGILAILLFIVRGKCTNCVEDESSKAKIIVASGVMFIISGLLCLIPVCWTANNVIHPYDPVMALYEKSELGAALFIGWGASALLILGGALLCANCPPKDNYSAKYTSVV